VLLALFQDEQCGRFAKEFSGAFEGLGKMAPGTRGDVGYLAAAKNEFPEQVCTLLVIVADAAQGIVVGGVGKLLCGLSIGFDSRGFPTKHCLAGFNGGVV